MTATRTITTPATSARQLTKIWEARDSQYATRRHNGTFQPLTDKEQLAVMITRRDEANALPVDDRASALAALAAWSAPVEMS